LWEDDGLRLVAGLEEMSEGTISIGGRVVNEIDPKDRDVAMVFQSYALYPHLSVARNIEFPCASAAWPRRSARPR
jgi:ABC-type sugar transport system ATPase subunit